MFMKIILHIKFIFLGILTYVTVPEKREKNREILMLVSRFNPPLRFVKILNDKTLYAQRDSQPNLPFSGRAIEVINEKTLIEVVPLPV